MPFSLASRSHRDNVGCEIPDQAESADAVDPPGTSSFLTMLALKAALYSVINNLTHPQRRWRPQPHHGEDGPDNSSDTGGSWLGCSCDDLRRNGGQLAHGHGRVGFGGREDLVFAKMGKERPLGAVGRSKSDSPYLSPTATSLRRRICTRKLPSPHAGSRKRESMRSVSPLTRSSMASTIHAGVKTSPWSATRFFDLIWLMGE